MADQLKSSVFTRVERLIWGLKLMLLFVGFMSTVFLFKVAVIPYSSDLILSTLPTLWMSLRFWLSPPFLFIIVNVIIFAILVSSFSQNLSKTPPPDGEIAIAGETSVFEFKLPDPNLSEDLKIPPSDGEIVIDDETSGFDFKHPDPNLFEDLKMVTEGEEREEEKQMVWNFSASSDEKVIGPLPEGSQEDHLFPDYCETERGEELVVDDGSLESTWKAILKEQVRHERHLKKSQTVGIPSRDLGRARAYAVYGVGDDDDDRVAWNKRELTKSDTFHESVSYLREKPMSQDELKRRSEAFIDKINADMRLQRLESAHRFLLRRG